MQRELPIPDFLKENADDIHKRMLNKSPNDICTIEGEFFWDCTRPTAEQNARLIQLQLQNTLKLAYTQTSYGEYLKLLGECKGVFENKSTKSVGYVKFTGKPGVVIKQGEVVSTPATNKKQAIEFETLESKQIDNSEFCIIKCHCKEPGVIGNVKKGTITVLYKSISGIRAITNENDFSGGTDIEDEEHFRERVIAAEQEDRLSGADTDYIRWAKEVPGVGNAYCIEEWDGPGTVKVLILDKNGQTATQELVKKVKDYIYPDKLPGKNRGGKAPIGAVVTITTPTTLAINIKAKFKFKYGFSQEIIFDNLKDKINKYLFGIKIGGTIRYNAIHTIVGSMILTNEGIEDFNELTINNGSENIILGDQVAVIGDVINL